MGYVGLNPQSYLDYQGAGSQPTAGLELVDSNVDFTGESTIEFSIPANGYDSYEFYFVNLHPANDGVGLMFQVDEAGGSSFNKSIVSTMFVATFAEASGSDDLDYNSADQAAGTGYPLLNFNTGNDNDQSCSGVLTLFGPSSTTYVKHFTYNGVTNAETNLVHHHHIAGYVNETTAIGEITFKFSSGNIDAGSIYMYGVK